MIEYEKLKKAEEELIEKKQTYKQMCFDYLNSRLEKRGMLGKTVTYKKTGERFVIRVEPGTFKPFCYKCYPIKKNGEISMKAKSIYELIYFQYENAEKVLKDNFEEVKIWTTPNSH